MFRCERCGSSFSATRAARTEHCPRCLGRDDVESPLNFSMFERSALERAGLSPRQPIRPAEARAGAESPASIDAA
ncbi:MAG: hypothetical protein QOI84_1893 [Solirubrobacterales bacterium]|jgi:hypothetical protein|nr:hypothetical protein [Solirubrobacterales bacterium]